MGGILKKLKSDWFSEESNIFRNYGDALAGFVVLVIIPAMSIGLVISTASISFWNYTFPLVSISLAGVYDTYGRYSGKSPKNVKLVFRAVFNSVAIIFAVIATDMDNRKLSFIAPCLLFLCGLLLIREIRNRLKTAFQINPWLYGDK